MWYGWSTKCFYLYFQPGPLSQILTMAKLWHAVSRVCTCAELGFRLNWMNLCSSDNHYTTMPRCNSNGSSLYEYSEMNKGQQALAQPWNRLEIQQYMFSCFFPLTDFRFCYFIYYLNIALPLFHILFPLLVCFLISLRISYDSGFSISFARCTINSPTLWLKSNSCHSQNVGKRQHK